MEYVYGTIFREGTEKECVKIIGTEHTDLKGFCHIERSYTDNIIVDDFRVVEKYQSDDAGDSCIDWYEIDNHRRYIDKFTPAKEDIDNGITESQDAVCALSEEMETRIADLEDALCALTEEV